MIFMSVNQNQYPLGVTPARYRAPICDTTRTMIVDQMRWLGLMFIPIRVVSRAAVSMFVISGFMEERVIYRVPYDERVRGERRDQREQIRYQRVVKLQKDYRYQLPIPSAVRRWRKRDETSVPAVIRRWHEYLMRRVYLYSPGVRLSRIIEQNKRKIQNIKPKKIQTYRVKSTHISVTASYIWESFVSRDMPRVNVQNEKMAR